MTSKEWDWTRTVVDHLDVHASRYTESVRFYETALTPLGIPKLYERESEACFTNLNVVDREPPTTNLHLCFHAYRDYGPGYHAAYLLDPDGNNVEALYRDVGNPGHTPAD